MPIATIWTNLTAENDGAKFDSEMRKAFIQMLADTLQKPVEGVALIVYQGPGQCQMGMDGNAPCIVMNIKSIGHLSAAENVSHARVVTEFFTQKLGWKVPASRVLIHFENLEKHEVAKNGTTVQVLLGEKP